MFIKTHINNVPLIRNITNLVKSESTLNSDYFVLNEILFSLLEHGVKHNMIS